MLALGTESLRPKFWEFLPGRIISHIASDEHPVGLFLPLSSKYALNIRKKPVSELLDIRVLRSKRYIKATKQVARSTFNFVDFPERESVVRVRLSHFGHHLLAVMRE
jgi:hypothetical protein